MRKALLVVSLVPTMAMAQQAISGTISAAFQGFNTYGQAEVQMSLALQCSLTCPPSAPTLHYGVRGLIDATFASAPTESAAYVSAGLATAVDPTGSASQVTTNFKAGTVFRLKAKSCSCWCGNGVGEGGYIDLETPDVVVPARVHTASLSAPGSESSVLVSAQPRGSESVDVQLSGAGLSETRSLTAADFGSNDSVFVRFTPTTAGTVAITATLRPSGVAQTATFTISSGSSGAGGGSGGGGGSTGGGAGGGGDEPSGCAVSPVSPLLVLALAALARRAR
ncbi:MAG: hypothetical protein ACOZQL_36835 [Myxococcota bacterium]